MDFIDITDEFGVVHRLYSNDAMYVEAKEEADRNEGKLTWPLQKIASATGWGWWTVFQSLEELDASLAQIAPDPGTGRIIPIDQELTPNELRDMLQRFGSYLSSLHKIQAKMEAQAHALAETFKSGMKIAMSRSDIKADSITAKEASILNTNGLLRQTRKMQIDHEAALILIKGWVKSYEAAYTSISRIAAVEMEEMDMQTSRTP